MFNDRYSRRSHSEGLLIPITVSAVGSAVILLIMLSICSMISLSIDVPQTFITPLATMSISAATFVSAAIFSGLFGKNGLLMGAVIGIITFMLIFIIALIYDLPSITGTGVIKFLLLTLSGAFGGYCGIMIREKRNRRKK